MSKKATIKREDNHLSVTGELNYQTVVSLWKESLFLFTKNTAEFYFDLSKVSSANSAGLALLLEWIKFAKRQKKTIQFHNIPDQLLSIAAVSGVEKILKNT